MRLSDYQLSVLVYQILLSSAQSASSASKVIAPSPVFRLPAAMAAEFEPPSLIGFRVFARLSPCCLIRRPKRCYYETGANLIAAL